MAANTTNPNVLLNEILRKVTRLEQKQDVLQQSFMELKELLAEQEALRFSIKGSHFQVRPH